MEVLGGQAWGEAAGLRALLFDEPRVLQGPRPRGQPPPGTTAGVNSCRGAELLDMTGALPSSVYARLPRAVPEPSGPGAPRLSVSAQAHGPAAGCQLCARPLHRQPALWLHLPPGNDERASE